MEDTIIKDVIEIVSPFAKNKTALQSASAASSFLKDLQVSSSRLVDIVLAIEDKFDIKVDDEEADKISTIGSAVELITHKQSANA